MSPRVRRIVTVSIGVVLLMIALVFGARSCSRRNKAAETTPSPAADKPVTTSALKSVENTIMSAITGLVSRVETLEKVKPSPMPKTGVSPASVKVLDRKFEKLNGEVGSFGQRLLDLEEKANKPLAVVQPAESEAEAVEEAPLTDAEAERRFARKLKNEAGRAGARQPN